MFKKIISIAMVCTMLASFVPNVTHWKMQLYMDLKRKKKNGIFKPQTDVS